MAMFWQHQKAQRDYKKELEKCGKLSAQDPSLEPSGKAWERFQFLKPFPYIKTRHSLPRMLQPGKKPREPPQCDPSKKSLSTTEQASGKSSQT